LSATVVHSLAEAGLCRMCIPHTLGGLEVSPLTFYRVVEEVARIDGSTGWCLFIGGAAPLVGAVLSDQAAEEMFGRDPLVVIGGATAPSGPAAVPGRGASLKGRLPSARGRHHFA